MSAANTSKSKSKSKPAAKAKPAKSVAKPAAKAAKPAAKAAKPAPKTAKSSAKPVKPVTTKVPAAAKAVEKAPRGKAAEKVAKPAAKPVKAAAVKAPKASRKSEGRPAEEELANAGQPDGNVADAEFAEDFAASEAEEAAEPVVQEEELSPSAALLRSMKPTQPDAEKAGDKKKKKDDLKLDRNGDLEAQWAQLKEKYKALKPVAYKMSESFEARTPILHKVLGWGFIITNQNDRLEVLFQQGIKFLISNYKA